MLIYTIYYILYNLTYWLLCVYIYILYAVFIICKVFKSFHPASMHDNIIWYQSHEHHQLCPARKFCLPSPPWMLLPFRPPWSQRSPWRPHPLLGADVPKIEGTQHTPNDPHLKCFLHIMPPQHNDCAQYFFQTCKLTYDGCLWWGEFRCSLEVAIGKTTQISESCSCRWDVSFEYAK